VTTTILVMVQLVFLQFFKGSMISLS